MNSKANGHSTRILNASEYEEAWSKLFHQATMGLVFQDAVFGMMRREETSHAGPIRNVRTPQPLDQPYMAAEYSASMSEEDVRQTNIARHTEFAWEWAESAKYAMGPQLFQSLAGMTSASGMNVDSGGQPISAEYVLQALEKLEIQFDDSGRPLLPKLVVHPSLGEAAAKALEEANKDSRHLPMMIRKRDEFFAKKRTRRLS